MDVLSLERMRVDVALAGQLLIMTRREKHLQNVITCLQVLASGLNETNQTLRGDYEAHLPLLAKLEARTQAIGTIDIEAAQADKTLQAAHTLQYEAEQFRLPDLWHTATPPRKKVLELREKVFGMGGRRLPQGVRGSHGRFNRLQWRLDGTEVLVDRFGRTEEEVEEEVVGIRFEPKLPEEDEGEVVSNPSIKPMWLLRFFTNWGAMWGARTRSSAPSGEKQEPETDEDKIQAGSPLTRKDEVSIVITQAT
jgi:hypothetical protein